MSDAFFLSKNLDSGNLPTLNTNYPEDAEAYVGGSNKTFNVKISIDGSPNIYTYQWYMDSELSPVPAISGGNTDTCTYAVPSSLETGINRETHTFFCKVQNAVGIVTSRVATMTVMNPLPVINSASVAASNTDITNEGNNDWHILCTQKNTSSNLLKFDYLPNVTVDICVIGGGGGGGSGRRYCGGGGGGGGYVTNYYNKSLSENTDYYLTIGAGGAGDDRVQDGGVADSGKTSSFYYSDTGYYSSSGGTGGKCASGGGAGGSGQSSGGAGGGTSTKGKTGSDGVYPYGESESEYYKKYGSGGGGGSGTSSGEGDTPGIAYGGNYNGGHGAQHGSYATSPNSDAYGGGGSGGCHNKNDVVYKGSSGREGCIIIRNHRTT